MSIIKTIIKLSLILAFLNSCQTPQPNTQKADTSMTNTLKNYISLDLEYGEYQNSLQKLDAILGTQLKSRNEAHITVITPPEFKTITEAITPDTIHQEWLGWSSRGFKKLCLGQGEIKDNGKTLSTYFIVLNSKDLLNFRLHLKTKYKITNFKAETFYPHITLGFTERDLHFENGVTKNQKSCAPKLQAALKK